MRAILFWVVCILAVPAMAIAPASDDTKSELKKLYHQINASGDPYNDEQVSAKVVHLVNRSCYGSAIKALKRRANISFETQENMKKVMASTCSCVANSKAMISGVIKSATLFKKHGKHSSSAKNAMSDGMKMAKEKCFTQMRQQIRR